MLSSKNIYELSSKSSNPARSMALGKRLIQDHASQREDGFSGGMERSNSRRQETKCMTKGLKGLDRAVANYSDANLPPSSLSLTSTATLIVSNGG